MKKNWKRWVALGAAGLLSSMAQSAHVALDLRQDPRDLSGSNPKLLSNAARDGQEQETGVLQSARLPAGATRIDPLNVGDELALRLFDDVEIELALRKEQKALLGGRTFLAEVAGYDGVMNAVVHESGEGLQIDIQDYRQGRVYTVFSGENGVEVRQVDPNAGTIIPTQPINPTKSPRERLLSSVEGESRLPQHCYIDVLIVYDANARAWANQRNGGTTNLSQVLVEKMNATIANTGLHREFQFRLVGVECVNVATNDLGSVLHSANVNKGDWAVVNEMRKKAGADIVSVMIDTGYSYGVVGMSYGEFCPYTACGVRSVIESSALTHEIGHVLGAGHSDRQAEAPGPQLFDFSSGYYFKVGSTSYATVMAYNRDGYGGSYTLIPYFSSPDYCYRGVDVGDAMHDNTRTIRMTYAEVAAMQEPKDVLFSPEPGTVFLDSVQVAMRSAYPGVSIRYTLDGSEPTASSPLYSGPIVLTETTTIRVAAISEDGRAVLSQAKYWKGDLSTALGVPELQWETSPANPWFVQTSNSCDGLAVAGTKDSWLSTTFEGPASFSLRNSCIGRWAITLDGEELYGEESAYSSWSSEDSIAFDIPFGRHELRLKCLDGWLNVDEMKFGQSRRAKISAADVVFRVNNSERMVENKERMVVLSHPNAGAKFYYTLDGTDPVAGKSHEYDGPFFVANCGDFMSSIQVKAVACEPGRGASIVSKSNVYHSFTGQHAIRPGEWTSDIECACAAAKKDGRMVVLYYGRHATSEDSRQFEGCAHTPEFLAWAAMNGIYLVSCEDSQFALDARVRSRMERLASAAGVPFEGTPFFIYLSPSNLEIPLGTHSGLSYHSPEAWAEHFGSFVGGGPLGPPSVSPPAGFDVEYPLCVKVSHADADAVIHYTLDGSEPAFGYGLSCDGRREIEIPRRGMTLKMAAWRPDGQGVSSIPAFVTFDDLDSYMNIPSAEWTNDESCPWVQAGKGARSLAAGKDFSGGESSRSTLQALFRSRGKLRFAWRVRSRAEPGQAKLAFSVNGNDVAVRTDGEEEVFECALTGKPSLLQWTYTCPSCDGDSSLGAWLRDIQWIPEVGRDVVLSEPRNVYGVFSPDYGPVVRWSPTELESGFEVYGGAVDDFAEAVLLGETSNCWFWDVSAGPGNRYYWVKSVCGSKESPVSGSVCVKDILCRVEFDLDGKGERAGGGNLVQYVLPGGNVEAPLIEERDGWMFVGWDRATLKDIRERTVVKALYDEVVEITFRGGDLALWDGLMVGTDRKVKCKKGSVCVPPVVHAMPGWRFAGWSGDLSDVTANMSVEARYEPIDIPKIGLEVAADWYVDVANGLDENDGKSGDAPCATLQRAVDLAASGDVIVVNDGVYRPVVIPAGKNLTIRSLHGSWATVIDGGNTRRCVTCADTGPVLDGFLLRRGNAYEGGGARYGTLNNCLLSGNRAHDGGATYGSDLNGCRIGGNAAESSGGGAHGGTLRSCILAGNVGDDGGGACSATLDNCTVVANSASIRGGVSFGTVCNCVIVRNTPKDIDNHSCTITYSCTDFEVPGIGNMYVEPRFMDEANGDFRLRPDSPCIDGGISSSVVETTDAVGNPRRIGPVDMGAIEFCPGTNVVISPGLLPAGAVNAPYLVQMQTSGGRADGSWYAAAAKTFSGNDATATELKFSGSDLEYRLPFEFEFYGRKYASVYVGQHGCLSFRATFSSSAISAGLDGLRSNALIAVLWNRLENCRVFASANAESVTFRWSARYYSSRKPANFSATLNRDGVVRLAYGDGNDSGGIIGVSAGDGKNYQLDARCQSGSMANAADVVFFQSDTLPQGLTLASDGTISGVPNDPGDYRFRVAVVDSSGETSIRDCALTVSNWHSSVEFDLAGHGRWGGGGQLTQKVAARRSASAPVVKAEMGWRFMGWDRDFSCVTNDLVVVALYEPTDCPTIVTETLPTATEMTPYHVQLEASGDRDGFSWTCLFDGYEGHAEARTDVSGGEPQGWTRTGCDNTSEPAVWECPLPFEFEFYGRRYAKVFVGGNGTLAFDPVQPVFSNLTRSAAAVDRSAMISSACICAMYDKYSEGRNLDIHVLSAGDFVRFRWLRTPNSNTGEPIEEFAATLFADGSIRLSYQTSCGSKTALSGISAGDGVHYALVSPNERLDHDVRFIPTLEPFGIGLPAGLELTRRGVIEGSPQNAGTYPLKVGLVNDLGEIVSKPLVLEVLDNADMRPRICGVAPSVGDVMIPAGQSVAFSVFAEDPETQPLTYRWYLDDGLVATEGNGRYVCEADLLAPGDHTLACDVSDGLWRGCVRRTWVVKVATTLLITPETDLRQLSNNAAKCLLFAPGVYDFGSITSSGGASGRWRGCRLIAVEGPSNTFMNYASGGRPWSEGSLNGCVLEGFSLTDGGTYVNSEFVNCVFRGTRDLVFSSCTLTGCVVVDTEGLTLEGGSTVAHSTFAGNRWKGKSNVAAFTGSIVWEEDGTAFGAVASFNHCCLGFDVTNGVGNVMADPRLVAPSLGDVRLRRGSPCLEAGSFDVSLTEKDLLGSPRVMGCAPDIGATEGCVSGCVVSVCVIGNGKLDKTVLEVPMGGTATFSAISGERPFDHFEKDGVILSKGPTLTIEDVREDCMVTAVFESYHFYVDAVNGDDANDGLSSARAKKTIQSAIDAALDGDSVTVLAGRYQPIVCDNKKISIVSERGAEETFIDAAGANASCAVLASATEGTNTVLRGFTLCNARLDTDQSGSLTGGGVCYGTLEDCVISNCVLRNTNSYGNAYGGGAYYGVLRRCLICDNSTTAGYYSEGGGSYGSELHDCILTGNACVGRTSRGGGAYSGTLENCTLCDNVATNGGGACSGTLNNCIVWGNGGRSGYENVYSTTIHNTWTGGDPCFVDPEHGDYRLRPDSPCIDAGANDYVASAVDLDGNPRICNGIVDMGAYEYVEVVATIDDGSGDGRTWYVGDTYERMIESPVVNGGTQLVFSAWSVWNVTNLNVIAGGTNATVRFEIENAGPYGVETEWATNCWLEVVVATNGTIGGAESGWQPAEETLSLFAKPAEGYAFAGWFGETDGCSVTNGGEVLIVPMDRARRIGANFAQLLPPLPSEPTTDDVRQALEGVADPKLQECITEPDEYDEFREWAGKVKDEGGREPAGVQAVCDSPNAWLSYALASDRLVAAAPEDGDLKVDEFKPTATDDATPGSFDFTVSVENLPVGDDARPENLARVFGIDGGSSLTDLSADKVAIEFGTPENGKVKLIASPKGEVPTAFFMRVKMRP